MEGSSRVVDDDGRKNVEQRAPNMAMINNDVWLYSVA